MQTIFYMSIEALRGAIDWKHELSKVSEQRRAKVLRCKSDGDRRRSLAAGLLQRFGEEKLTESERRYSNVTHSGDYAAVAFSCDPVGVDLELISRFADGQGMIGARQLKKMAGVARKAFSAEEKTAFENLLAQQEAGVGQLPGERPVDFFLRTWTRKEAYAKQIGRGIAMDLASIDTMDDKNFHSVLLEESFWLSVSPRGEKTVIEKISFDCLKKPKMVR